MSKEKGHGNQSLVRGLRLMEMLGNYPNGCSLAKLTELSGLNKSTVHRLLQGLQSEGYVQPTNTAGSYRLTTKCLSLGQQTLSSLNIIGVAMPYLEGLNLTLGETVNFSKREGDHGVMIYKLEPTSGMMRTRAHIGQHLPLYCSAMGKLFLAFEPDDDYLSHYWHHQQTHIRQLTENTIMTIDQMKTELTEIRAERYAMDREENELGVMCIAFPIFNHAGRVEYAVSVSASVHRFSQIGIKTVLAALKETAKGISKELGG